MITYRQVTAQDWPKTKRAILRLVRNHQDQHITRRTFNNLSKLRSSRLQIEGNVVWIAVDESKLAGVIICEGFGNRTSMCVVHRSYRSQGIGKQLLKRALATMGRFYAEVAADNVPSMKVLFGMGMVAYDVFLRRGKPTLRVKNGFAIDRSIVG